MISRFKKFYASKTPREKILLITLIWAPILLWLSSLYNSQREISENCTLANAALEKAESTISMRQKAEEDLKRAMGDFDEKMLVKDLGVELEAIMQSMQLAGYSMSPANPKPSGRMTIYTVTVNMKGVSIDMLADFERRIIARSPYISMSLAEFNTDGKGVMSARYEINSFEFNDKK